MNVHIISLGYLVQSYVAQKLLVSLSEGGVSLNHDIVILAKFDCVLIDVERVTFDLIHDGLHDRELYQSFQVSCLKVGYSRSSEELLLHFFFENPPAVMSILDVLWVCVF